MENTKVAATAPLFCQNCVPDAVETAEFAVVEGSIGVGDMDVEGSSAPITYVVVGVGALADVELEDVLSGVAKGAVTGVESMVDFGVNVEDVDSTELVEDTVVESDEDDSEVEDDTL